MPMVGFGMWVLMASLVTRILSSSATFAIKKSVNRRKIQTLNINSNEPNQLNFIKTDTNRSWNVWKTQELSTMANLKGKLIENLCNITWKFGRKR